MKQKDLRTYRRRSTTRESGYHTCEDATGGECIVLKSQKHIIQNSHEIFTFRRDNLDLVELFESSIGRT